MVTVCHGHGTFELRDKHYQNNNHKIKEGHMKKQSEITPRTGAQRLGVSLYFVYQLLWTGKLQGRKVGKQWRIPAEAIEARLKRRGE